MLQVLSSILLAEVRHGRAIMHVPHLFLAPEVRQHNKKSHPPWSSRCSSLSCFLTQVYFYQSLSRKCERAQWAPPGLVSATSSLNGGTRTAGTENR